ncbi:Hypothetical protein BCETI_7000350 [Brucella ceti str. Cudo]|uniref:Uncharacterized protein n=1 Tax=Brucella ceti str. Cudo TaxID=595497 RepID=C0GAN1_9HYPH|nr:Hypothetical protein BCETI_7000350 [Brucella ceti str. Cudo]
MLLLRIPPLRNATYCGCDLLVLKSKNPGRSRDFVAYT